MGRRRYDKDPEYHIKYVNLPGGKVIQVVYIPHSPSDQDLLDLQGVALDGDVDLFDLHVCPKCFSELVYPISWEERTDDHWFIHRRCPNCEWSHCGEFTQDEAALYNDALDDDTEDFLISLREFARTNMEDDVERLIEAIHTGLIEPMDF